MNYCQRCKQEKPPSHRVTSDAMVVDVCDQCVSEAWDLLQIQRAGISGMIESITPLKEARG